MNEDLLPYSEDGRALILPGAKPCFMCKQPTTRLDICFEAPLCNSDACNQAIADDLKRLG